MERKATAPRNPFVAAAKFKKAGTHRKSNKALRRVEKMSLLGHSSKVEQSAFTRSARVRFPLPQPAETATEWVHASSFA